MPPSGFWVWLFVHIYYLAGFKNRFFVILQWAYSYLSYRRGARLVVDGEPEIASNPEDAE